MRMRSMWVAVCFSTLALFACSSSGTSSTGTQSSDSASCIVAITQYDQSCTQDADCVAAPPGGDTCGVCHQHDPAFECKLAALNAKDSARYANDLSSAFAGQSTAPQEGCATSCPVGEVPKCDQGTCKLEPADAGH